MGGEVPWGCERQGHPERGRRWSCISAFQTLGVRLTGQDFCLGPGSTLEPSLCRPPPPPPLAGYSFPMMITRCHNLGGLEQWEHVLSRFWRPEAQSQVTSGPHRSAGSWGASFLASSRFWWLQAVLGSRLHPSARCLRLRVALSHAPSLRMVSLLHVCPDSPLLRRTPVTGRELTLAQDDLILTRWNLQRPSP